MNLDLIHLRQLAEAATPGPWRVCAGGRAPYVAAAAGTPIVDLEITGAQIDFEQADAEHIAAFGPETALALLAVVEAAQRFRQIRLASTDGKQTQRGQRSKLLQEMGERLDAALAPFTEAT